MPRYLLLASDADGTGAAEATLRRNNATQHAAGADWVRLLERAELAERFPWLSLDGVALGSLGERNEGYFDPWALLQGLRRGAIDAGVE